MSIKEERLVFYTLIFFMICIGIYHTIIPLIKHKILEVDKNLIFPIHAIPYNLIIITLLLDKFSKLKLIKRLPRQYKYYGIIISSYFLIKIIANILIAYFSIDFKINEIGALLCFFIFSLLIIIKLIK